MGERFLRFADVVDKETGKTLRELNNEKEHKIPVGTLVEVIQEPPLSGNGLRLHVIEHSRDCDGTPLYTLGVAGSTWTDEKFVHNGFTGYSEYSLKVIEEPTEELLERIKETQDYWNGFSDPTTADLLERLKG